MSSKGIEEMKVINIAHLVGRMEFFLEMIEYQIGQIEMNDYQKEYLIEQIDKASNVNNEILELYKKNELDRIKKTYNNRNNESE